MTNELIHFLNQSPTAWHAVEQIAGMLRTADFEELHEEESWEIAPGRRYFVIRNGSSIAAFITPTAKPLLVRMAASHTDSPGFKLKPQAEYRKDNCIMLGLEVYGSPLIASWFNRDLGIAGRFVYLDNEKKIQERLVCFNEPRLIIPQLAIHLDRKVNEEGVQFNKQEQLAALAGIADDHLKFSLLDSLFMSAVPNSHLLSSELFLFPLELACTIGFNNALIASYRIDNLVSSHAAVLGICQAKPDENALKLALFWDHEEIGSSTSQGAGSPFAAQTLERIIHGLKLEREDYFRLISRSLCLSIDLAHAVHPNYSGKHEPLHPVYLGKGIAIKQNAQFRYATDARSSATIIDLCQKNKIPFQHFVSRGDMPCGTTIGPIHAQTTGMPTVDIGCPQLSMHSCRELTACQDYLSMCALLSSFWHS